MVEPLRHRQTKEADNRYVQPKATAPHLDSTDAVEKLGQEHRVRNYRIRAESFLNLEGSVRSSGMTPAAPRGPRPHRSRIERSRARWGTMGIVAEACWCSTLGLGWGVRAEGGLFARGAGT